MAQKGRDPMKGRHAVGQQTARPGSIPRGQGARTANGVGTGYNQQTASKSAMRPKAPVLTNQATTSEGAQRTVRRPPMPFADPQGSLNVPAPRSRDYRSDGSPSELRDRPKHVGCANTSLSAEEAAAVGYDPSDTKGTWSLISGHATKNNPRQAGKPGSRNSNTSARENSRMRQG